MDSGVILKTVGVLFFEMFPLMYVVNSNSDHFTKHLFICVVAYNSFNHKTVSSKSAHNNNNNNFIVV